MTPLYSPKINSSSSSYPNNPSKNRNKLRSMSLQSLPSPPPTLKSSPLQPVSYPDLPSDLKRWSSSHVASYLNYCLRIYPPAIVSDLSRHVEENVTLTGRKFLRLKEEQLRQMNFNEKWIKLIMVGVKVLRREHLKDKILLNGGDIISEGLDDMKITQESSEGSSEEREQYFSLTRSPLERNSSITSSTSSFSNDDLKDFYIPTSFSNLSSDDKEFISQEFNKLKEFLKSDIEKENDDTKFNELNRFIEKALLDIETNRENIHVKGSRAGSRASSSSDDKIVEVEVEVNNEISKTTRSLFSSNLINWLNNAWTKNVVFESGFAKGVMIGGVAVWTFMRYYKW